MNACGYRDGVSLYDGPRITTGSLVLDEIMGGGLPIGRIVNFWGNPGSGKTTAALLSVIATLRQGGNVLYVDVENTYDAVWAYRLGLTEDLMQNFVLVNTETGEEAINTITEAVREDVYIDPETGEIRGAWNLIVLDSIGMLDFEPERQGEAGDAHISLMARAMSTFVRVAQGRLARLGITLLTINHVTMKIGTRPGQNPETQPGGKKLRFANSVEIYFGAPLYYPKDKSKPATYVILSARCTKNKTTAPFRKGFIFLRVDGIDGPDVALELAGTSEKGVGGVDTSGLLKKYGLLLNKDGIPYSAGGMYYRPLDSDELTAITYQQDGGATKPAASKSELFKALQQNPALRAELIGQVYAAILAANSFEGIRAALKKGELVMAGAEPVPAEEDIISEYEEEAADDD